jgi:hypothetical protein
MTKSKKSKIKKPKNQKPEAAKEEVAESMDEKTWIEEIEVAGENLVAQAKHLSSETSVRRLRILEPDGDIAVDIPLTVGAVAGGALVLAAPILAVLGAVAAFATKVKIEIVRVEDSDDQRE